MTSWILRGFLEGRGCVVKCTRSPGRRRFDRVHHFRFTEANPSWPRNITEFASLCHQHCDPPAIYHAAHLGLFCPNHTPASLLITCSPIQPYAMDWACGFIARFLPTPNTTSTSQYNRFKVETGDSIGHSRKYREAETTTVDFDIYATYVSGQAGPVVLFPIASAESYWRGRAADHRVAAALAVSAAAFPIVHHDSEAHTYQRSRCYPTYRIRTALVSARYPGRAGDATRMRRDTPLANAAGRPDTVRKRASPIRERASPVGVASTCMSGGPESEKGGRGRDRIDLVWLTCMLIFHCFAC